MDFVTLMLVVTFSGVSRLFLWRAHLMQIQLNPTASAAASNTFLPQLSIFSSKEHNHLSIFRQTKSGKFLWGKFTFWLCWFCTKKLAPRCLPNSFEDLNELPLTLSCNIRCQTMHLRCLASHPGVLFNDSQRGYVINLMLKTSAFAGSVALSSVRQQWQIIHKKFWSKKSRVIPASGVQWQAKPWKPVFNCLGEGWKKCWNFPWQFTCIQTHLVVYELPLLAAYTRSVLAMKS